MPDLPDHIAAKLIGVPRNGVRDLILTRQNNQDLGITLQHWLDNVTTRVLEGTYEHTLLKVLLPEAIHRLILSDGRAVSELWKGFVEIDDQVEVGWSSETRDRLARLIDVAVLESSAGNYLARIAIVLSISFLGRDRHSDRLQDTIDSLIPRLVEADKALQGYPPSVPISDLVDNTDQLIADAEAYIDQYPGFRSSRLLRDLLPIAKSQNFWLAKEIRKLLDTHGGDFVRCEQCDHQQDGVAKQMDLFMFIDEAVSVAGAPYEMSSSREQPRVVSDETISFCYALLGGWLSENPQQVTQILEMNPSEVRSAHRDIYESRSQGDSYEEMMRSTGHAL